MKKIYSLTAIAIATITLTGCETISSWFTSSQNTPTQKVVIKPQSFDELKFTDDNEIIDGLNAFKTSCNRILKNDPNKNFGDGELWGKYADWQNVCNTLNTQNPTTADSVKDFIKNNFNVFSLSDGQKDTGLLTGYYEPLITANDKKTDEYQIPIRARPDDLVMVNLGEFRPELKGQRIAGLVNNGYLKPYFDRAEIEDGKLKTDMDKPIYWAKSAVDVFFLQIQGSGILSLPSGETVRVGYDGQNGHPYTAIGRELIARGILTKENVNMDSIKEWLINNPVEGREVMRLNRSYVFFKKMDTNGAVGGEGVVLTPKHSLAIDRKYLPYGIPLFITSDQPKFARLMVAQDTGGAIIGVLRGDVFWGAGNAAGDIAGPMKAKGKFWVFLPKTVTNIKSE